MNRGRQTVEAPLPTPPRSLLVRAGLRIAGAMSVAVAVLSAATVYLVLSQPAAVAATLAERQPSALLDALAGIVVAALLNLVSCA